ncbi:MAG TPA: DUF502 domain-containing protein [Legionellaceae bacterium]|nr:DUF502 domain-containing protein [Legionellaceae bacterium]
MRYIRSYLLAGLVVWLPILLTIWILSFIIELLDHSIALLPATYQPARVFGINIPGLGVIFSLVILLFTGLVATNFLGQRLMRWSELFLDKIPLVRSIYNTSKQMIQAVFSTNSQAFRKVVMVEYPRKGLWTLAFQTGTTSPELTKDLNTNMISIFVPTTPNPTAGFLLMVSKSEIKEISMTVEDALKYIISLGVMQMPHKSLPKEKPEISN